LNGEPFMLNWLYSATTINIPDSIRGSVVVRSVPADAFRLEIPEWKVQNLVVEDGSDFGDGRDLDVLFEPAQDESTIAAYRIACWPVFETKSPNEVLQAPAGRWLEVPPGATSYAVDFDSTTDLNGDPIQLDRIYKVMVMSRSLPGQASESVQGSGSISGYGMDPGPLEQFDIADFEDGRDWQIVASPAQFADSIAEYRVYAIRQPASDLNASDLLPLPSDRYQRVAPSVPFDTLLLSSKLLDHEGDSLRFGNRYRLALVSVPAPGVALAPGFSMPLGSDTYKDEQWTPERPLWSQDPISSAWLLHSEGAPNETFFPGTLTAARSTRSTSTPEPRTFPGLVILNLINRIGSGYWPSSMPIQGVYRPPACLSPSAPEVCPDQTMSPIGALANRPKAWCSTTCPNRLRVPASSMRWAAASNYGMKIPSRLPAKPGAWIGGSRQRKRLHRDQTGTSWSWSSPIGGKPNRSCGKHGLSALYRPGPWADGTCSAKGS
jgi:hypothetical protein